MFDLRVTACRIMPNEPIGEEMPDPMRHARCAMQDWKCRKEASLPTNWGMEMTCANCGADMASDAKICSACGAHAQAELPPAEVVRHRLWSGVPGGVAFAASIVCAQAWVLIIGGLLTALFGNSLRNFDRSFGSDCTGTFAGCTPSGNGISSVGQDAIYIGLFASFAGLLLLVAVLDALKGHELGRVACFIFELILLLVGAWVGVETKNAVAALIVGVWPLFTLPGLIGKSSTRLMLDAAAVDGSVVP